MVATDAPPDIATDEEKLSIVNAIGQGLDDGAVGIGFGIAYMPSTTREEILRLFQLASNRRVFKHTPRGPMVFRLQRSAIDEI